MKRSLAMVLALALAFTLTACGSTSTSSDGAVGASIQRNQPTQQLESTPESPEPEEPEAEYVPHDPIVLTGSGDDVLEIDSLDYYYAFRITGGAAGKHFAVTTYDGYGQYNDLLVNTTDPYEGKVILEGDPVIAVVKATGDWSFTLN